MIDPTLVGAAVVGVISAGVFGALQIMTSRASAAERAKDRAEAAEIRAIERAEAAEERKAMLAKASQAVAVSESNGKKSDELIVGVAKVHELTNSTNSELQKALALMTEKFAGSERLNAQMREEKKDTATSQATADMQVNTAMHTVPVVAALTPDARAGDHGAAIEKNTADTAKNTERTDATVQELKDKP